MIDKKEKLGEMFEIVNLPTIRLYKTGIQVVLVSV